MPPEGNNADSRVSGGVRTETADCATPPATPISDDIPCVGCRYDLRGLTPPGVCPECGHDLYSSILVYEAERIRLPPPDPQFARQVVEGATASLLAFGLMLVLALLWPRLGWWAYPNAPASKTPGRVVLLAIHCAAWVLTWFSTWKLTRKPPAKDTWNPGLSPPSARALMTVYMVVPFAWAAAGPESAGGWWLTLLLVAMFCGTIATMPLFIAIGALFQRAGGSSNEATIAALLNPLAVVAAWLFGMGGGGISSLDLMLALPLGQYGSPAWIVSATVDASRGQLPHPLLALALAVTVWNASLFFRLRRRYRLFTRVSGDSIPPAPRNADLPGSVNTA